MTHKPPMSIAQFIKSNKCKMKNSFYTQWNKRLKKIFKEEFNEGANGYLHMALIGGNKMSNWPDRCKNCGGTEFDEIAEGEFECQSCYEIIRIDENDNGS